MDNSCYTFSEITEGHTDLVCRLFLIAQRTAQDRDIATSSCRTLINAGLAGGQTVYPFHLHLPGGRQMT